MKILTREEVKRKADIKAKRGRKIKEYFFTMKGSKRPKRSRFQLRQVFQGYASLNWDNISLGRK